MPLTLVLQSVHLAAACSAFIAPPGEGPMDSVVASMWETFEACAGVTHQPMFEASVAVLAFVAWILFFESLHLWWPNAVEHRLDGKPPERALNGFGSEIHKTTVPAVAYWGTIYLLFDQLGLGYYLFGAKPLFETPSFGRVALEVASGIFLYDLLFYPFHSSFHQLRVPRWRRLHLRHHRFASEETVAHNAVETVQNSYADAGIQVAINILVQNLSPWGLACKHPLSRLLHNLLVTYLLSESHSGYDLPFQSHRLFPAVFGGAPRHEHHHQRGDVCFHQFFKYLDDARGTGPKADFHAAEARRLSHLSQRRRQAGTRVPSAAPAPDDAASAPAARGSALAETPSAAQPAAPPPPAGRSP